MTVVRFGGFFCFTHVTNSFALPYEYQHSISTKAVELTVPLKHSKTLKELIF